MLSACRSRSVKRVVVVSSVKACSSDHDVPPRTYTEEDWNDDAVRTVEAQGRSAPLEIKYDASKTLAERAAWDFLEHHKSEAAFDLTMVNPSWVFGPVADDTLPSPSSLPGTPLHFYNTLFAPHRPSMHERTPVCTNFVHVRDVTKILIRALEMPEAGGERFIANASVSIRAHWLLANQTLNLIPALEKIDPADAEAPCPPHPYFGNEKSKRILGIEYRGVRETLVDAVDDFRARGWLKDFGVEA
ncbi:NAD(P)-binding protein [Trametes sanguinea]|nr:NAD(P)-binding protein [Trametes sanguinea]